jgi:hypothetical protein
MDVHVHCIPNSPKNVTDVLFTGSNYSQYLHSFCKALKKKTNKVLKYLVFYGGCFSTYGGLLIIFVHTSSKTNMFITKRNFV